MLIFSLNKTLKKSAEIFFIFFFAAISLIAFGKDYYRKTNIDISKNPDAKTKGVLYFPLKTSLGKNADALLFLNNYFLLYRFSESRSSFEYAGRFELTEKEFGKDIIYFSFGIKADSKNEILFLFYSEGIFVYDFLSEKKSAEPIEIKKKDLVKISDISSLKTHSDLFQVRYLEFVQDINSDGLSDIIAFNNEGTDFLIQNEYGKFLKTEDLPIRNENYSEFYAHKNWFYEDETDKDEKANRASSFSFSEVSVHGQFMLCDFDNDGNKEIKIREYRIKEKTGDLKDEYCYKFYVLKRSDAHSYNFEEKKSSAFSISADLGAPYSIDLNADMFIDAIRVESNDDLLMPVVKIQIYYNKSGKGIDFEKPDFILKNKDFSRMVLLDDWNKDGRKDICVPYSDIAITSSNDIARFFIGGKIKIIWRFFQNSMEGFKNNPNFEIPTEMEGNILQNYSQDYKVADIHYDFNADGYSDFFLISDKNTANVYFYNPQKNVFSAKPDYKFDLIEKCSIKLSDINSDGKTDLIYYSFEKSMVTFYVSGVN